jgi:dienelactone hydrolase
MAASHRPRHRFDDAAAADFGAWKRRAQPEVLACLGDFPPRVPANPELVAEWRDRGVRTQRWLLDVQPHLAAALLVNFPENLKPGERRPAILYLHATMFGTTSLALNVAHGRAATDFVCTLPEVDAQRLGVMGLSGGGTMTTWSYLCDERFGAAEIVCYCDLWAAFGLRDNNYCGMQVAPGLYKLVDLPDLQGLLAPRPLLVDIGARDTCFTIDTSLAAYRRLEAIYRAAGAADKLELDLHPGEHGWGGNRSVAFFGRHLGQ